MKHLPFLITSAFLCCLAATPALAQWSFSQTNGPLGGNVMGLAIAGNGSMFITTVEGVFRSTNEGASWQRVRQRKTRFDPGGDVTAITCSPSGTVYASAQDGLFASYDNGENWRKLNLSNDGLYKASQLLVDARGTLYAARWPILVSVSNDSGGTWIDLNTDVMRNDLGGWTLAVDSSAHLFLGTQSALYRSPAATISWTALGIGSGCASLHVGRTGTIFACINGGLRSSTDGGDTWLPRSGTPSQIVTGNATGSLVLSRQVSFDEGNTVHDMDLSRIGRDHWEVRGITARNRILLGHAAHGVFVSDDSGKSWQQSQLVNANVRSLCATRSAGLLAGTYGGGISRSSDGGAHWTLSGLADYDVTLLREAPDGTLYAAGKFRYATGQGSRLFVSIDSGRTWNRNHMSGTSLEITDLATQADGGVWLASGYGVEFSSDRGGTWTRASLEAYGYSQPASIALAPSGAILAGVPKLGLYSSSDRGLTWTRIPYSKTDSLLQTIAAHPATGSLFVATSSAIYRSSDEGATWEQVAPGVREIFVDRSGALLARTERSVLRSADDGRTWTSTTVNAFTGDIQAFALDASDHLYLGTRADGVYRSDQRVVGVKPAAIAAPRELRLRPYPNPAGDVVTLEFELQTPSAVAVIVYNTLGAVLHEERSDRVFPAGKNSILLPLHNVPDGLLVCRMTSTTASAVTLLLRRAIR